MLSSNDDKRLQTPDKITTYPYGTDEMMVISKSVSKFSYIYFIIIGIFTMKIVRFKTIEQGQKVE